ncbi:aldo/keto reductase [Polynucleobacter necessarius]|uniref:aldo/keto reductase n=1 Tax=Polynucleobacter necessarius TaxID=576610 RepID=UPI0013B066EE|nr:aldo/keto reductase [Polynucleobacter necessarius]
MINKFTKRISIGTAQFGSAYGIANRVGEVSEDHIAEMLTQAKLNGIKKLDTAPSYGNAESKLGKYGVKDFEITTKVSKIPPEVDDIRGHITREVDSSIIRLGVNCIDTVLFHNEKDLEGHRGYLAYQALYDLQLQGLVKKIGVSTYFSDSLEAALREYKFQTIQVPYSIVDRRLEFFNSRLDLYGIGIQARSIFLQGLLLLQAKEAMKRCKAWGSKAAAWSLFLNENKCAAYDAALYFGLSNSNIETFVVGLDSLEQLQMLLYSLKSFNGNKWLSIEQLKSEDENLLNPFAWKRLDE